MDKVKPAPRRLPVPSASKLLTPATKRSRSNEDNGSVSGPQKRRKLSDELVPLSTPSANVLRKTSVSSLGNRNSGDPMAKKTVARTTQKPVPRTGPRTVRSGPTANSSMTKTTAKPAAAGGGKKSRPAWDLKGRLQDMEEHMKMLSDKYQHEKALFQDNEVQLQSLANDKENILLEHRDYERKIEDLKSTLSERDDMLSSLRRNFSDVEHDRDQLKHTLGTTRDDLEAAQAQIRGLKTSVAEMSAAQEQIKASRVVLKVNLETANGTIAERTETLRIRTRELEESQTLVAQLQEQLREVESERRVLHNTIQELKGNIRVFCRVRPLLEKEMVGVDEIEHLSFPDDGKSLEITRVQDGSANETLSGNRKGSKFEFKFDRVFEPESSQADIFEEISQLVQSALDGYNVCIFAYGQTGSGKTFTMEGAGRDPALQGMIPRSVSLIFDFVATLLDKGWQYKFEASFLEIYNETIRDLLADSQSENVKHEIKMVQAHSSEVYVTNMTTVEVTQKSEVNKLLEKAAHNRAVAETKCNARSSRSHSVFRLRISGTNTHTHEKCIGVLNLIDLAGSERVKESGSEGVRLKEATAINGSLSHLGNVIMALANKENHVPYRNSKLTHLLQNCLGGSSKVLMFVNVSPREDCISETLNSLRFATKVNNCHIGTAQKKSK